MGGGRQHQQHKAGFPIIIFPRFYSDVQVLGNVVQGTVECLGCKKSELHSNTPIKPPCPASKLTGED